MVILSPAQARPQSHSIELVLEAMARKFLAE